MTEAAAGAREGGPTNALGAASSTPSHGPGMPLALRLISMLALPARDTGRSF